MDPQGHEFLTDRALVAVVAASPNYYRDLKRGGLMSDMCAIVSKAIFSKAKNTNGDPVTLGTVYDVDAYHSTNKSILKKLTGDLYLFSVVDGALWLVAILKSPTHDGESWRAKQNVHAATDVTSVADEIQFDTGKGINTEKMAMSLQTPRVLTNADIALLVDSPTTNVSPKTDSDESLDDLLVRLIAATLSMSEEMVRGDKGKYAVFHNDDGFAEFGIEDLDWKTLTYHGEPLEDDPYLYGRTDFDWRNSLIWDECLADETDNEAVLALLDKQHGFLFASQIPQLMKTGFSPDEFDYPTFLGRIACRDDSLVESMRGLFMLTSDGRIPWGEFAEVDPKWEKLVNSIPEGPLRDHIGNYFQEMNAARCEGAYYAFNRSMWHFDDIQHYLKPIASWEIGEGQGDFCICRIENEWKPEPVK